MICSGDREVVRSPERMRPHTLLNNEVGGEGRSRGERRFGEGREEEMGGNLISS